VYGGRQKSRGVRRWNHFVQRRPGDGNGDGIMGTELRALTIRRIIEISGTNQFLTGTFSRYLISLMYYHNPYIA
jgi:hypothetical protein